MTVQSRPKRVSEPPEPLKAAPSAVPSMSEQQGVGESSEPPDSKSVRPKKAPRVLLGLVTAAAVIGSIVWVLGRGKEFDG